MIKSVQEDSKYKTESDFRGILNTTRIAKHFENASIPSMPNRMTVSCDAYALRDRQPK